MTQLYTREMWGALPLGPTGKCSPEFIFVHHTTGARLGADLSDDWVRNIDRQHKYANGWAGIGYSYLFDFYGNIFEGRGFGVAGAHTEGWNSRGHGFAYLGNGDESLSQEAMLALRWLVGEHDKRYGQKPIEGHRQKGQTHCPGNWIQGRLNGLRGDNIVVVPTNPGEPVSKPFENLAVDGGFGPATVRALQAALNRTGAKPQLVMDGIYGPGTKRALQARLNHVAGPVTIDGVVGPNTVRALQRHVGAVVDGAWGKNTTRKLQEALNTGRF